MFGKSSLTRICLLTLTEANLACRVPKIGNSWRISNDIYNSWRSIWRITNQVVPFYKYTGPGAFPDMDMLM